jgi:hypothetical protein
MSNEKKFFGSVKTIETKYGPMTKLSFKKTELAEMMGLCNEKGFINLNLKESQKTPGSLYMELDTWQPSNNSNTDGMPF